MPRLSKPRLERLPNPRSYRGPYCFVASVCLLGAWLPHAVAQTPVTVEDVLRANERNIRDAQQRKVPEADVFLQDKISPPEKSEPRALDTEGCLPVVQYELAGLASSMPAPPPRTVGTLHRAVHWRAATQRFIG
jgi:hypothetical protein